MKSEKSFRKSVGGFNTHDVIEYLSEITRQHQEETDALRAGAEKLRIELEQAMADNAQKGFANPSGDDSGEAMERLREERDRISDGLTREQAENLRMRSEQERLRIELSTTEDKLAETVRRGESERAALLAAVAELNNENEQLRAAGTSGGHAPVLKEMEVEREALLEERRDLKGQLHQALGEVEALREKLSELREQPPADHAEQGDIAELQAQNEALRTELLAQKESAIGHAAEMGELNNQIAALEEKIAALKAESDESYGQTAELEAQIAALEAKTIICDTQRTELDACVAELLALKAEKSEWMEERESIREALETFLSERKAFNEAKAEFETERAKLLEEMAAAARDNLAITASKEEIARREDELNARHSALVGEQSQYDARIDALAEEKEALEARLAESGNAIDVLQSRIGILESEREQDKEALAANLALKNEWDAERQVWQTRTAALESEREELLRRIEMSAMSEEKIRETNERAVHILHTANEEALRVRRETEILISETRALYNEALNSGKTSSLSIVLELDKMRSFYAHFGDRFAEMDQRLQKLETNGRRQIRTFTPDSFEG